MVNRKPFSATTSSEVGHPHIDRLNVEIKVFEGQFVFSFLFRTLSDELPIRQRIAYRTTREHLTFDDVNAGNAAL